jgi:RNA polymerase sigma-70 factor (ECF subfamily)
VRGPERLRGLTVSTQVRTETDAQDVALLEGVARGDERAFANLYDRYSPILFGLLLRILHSRAEAEDVLQEVCLQIWQQAQAFDAARGRPFTWLVTLARSRAIDRLRAVDARRRAAERSAEDGAAIEASAVSADADAERNQQGEIVRRALSELPAEQRQALLLAYLGGMSQSEIAAAEGLPLGTVKTRTRAGLKKLSELLRNRLGRYAV